MIEIVPMQAHMRKPAARLAARVFSYAAPYVRLSFWAQKNREKPVVKLGLRLSSIADLLEQWVAVNERGDVVGTIGLYTYKKDAHEAVWMAWFCVDPAARGQGIGKRLIACASEHARARGARYFRLYTSTMPNEAAAQIVYEKHGFRLTHEKRRPFCKILYRELKL